MAHLRILLVDDDRVFRTIVTVILQEAGYDVAAVADGRAGITSARSQRPDVVILNVAMDSIDGDRYIDELHAAGLENVPVLAVSGTRCMPPEGTQVLLIKPIEASLLLSVLSSLRPKEHAEVDGMPPEETNF